MRNDKIIRWNDDKNKLLKQKRGIGFEIIETLIENGEILDILANSNYPNQKNFVFEIEQYVVSVPVVESENEIFLKTIFKSRKLHKKHKGIHNENQD